MMWYRQCARVALLAAGVMWSGISVAAPAPWPEVPFKYYATQYSVPRALHDFAKAFGLQLELSPQVAGRIDGEYSAATPTVFLDVLSSSNGLTWYYDQGVLHVAKANESIRRTLHVSAVDVGRLRGELTDLGLFEPRFGWAEFPERGMVIVSGPPSYVARIASTVDALGAAPSDGREIRIFPLKYARAQDYTFSYHNQQVTTPGIVSLLRNLVATPTEALQSAVSTLSVAPVPLPPLPALPPLPKVRDANDASTLPNVNPSMASDSKSDKVGNTGGVVHATSQITAPVIEAEPRLNAVIIRDAPERMPIYEALIRQLDVPSRQIEIEAMIVDVDTDAVNELGVAWEAHTGDVTFGFGARGNNQATILSLNTDSFFARVHALTTTGQARILGRPSILTVDNLAAVLAVSETFYVRINGERGALVPVSAGTLLRVTPSLIDDSGKRAIDLIVDIQDGQLHENFKVDALPTVRQSDVNTRAIVRNDDSLLIGGYFMDSDSSDETRVPWLGNLPVIGALFRDRHTERKRSERLFIIRPHIVDANPESRGAQSTYSDTMPASQSNGAGVVSR